MTSCQDCGLEMTETKGCSYTKIEINGKKFKRNTYGFDEDDITQCHDCGRVTGYHHFGCDVERCPNCKRQLISCECEKGEPLRS